MLTSKEFSETDAFVSESNRMRSCAYNIVNIWPSFVEDFVAISLRFFSEK